MLKPVLMVSTCGTSLLTNSHNEQPSDILRKNIYKFANAKHAEDIPEEWRKAMQTHIANRRQILLGVGDFGQAKKLSAELNSLLGYYQGQLKRERDEHVLLCTDTWLGEQTASILCEWLKDKNKLNVQVVRIPDLQTAELRSFHLAMSEIVTWCEETIPGYHENNYKVVFNLTGGFKSIQGFMQTLGMFYADESIYTFESGQHLLSLPKLPVKLDVEHTLHKGLQAFRRANVGLVVKEEEIDDLPETMFTVIEGKATLSPWGDLMWKQGSKTIMAEKLLEPISPLMIWGDKFEGSLKGLNAEQLAVLNQLLDELARNLEDGTNLRGLRFHQLKSPPKEMAPSTHEIYVWSGDKRRAYGHYGEAVFVVDRLDDHL